MKHLKDLPEICMFMLVLALSEGLYVLEWPDEWEGPASSLVKSTSTWRWRRDLEAWEKHIFSLGIYLT